MRRDLCIPSVIKACVIGMALATLWACSSGSSSSTTGNVTLRYVSSRDSDAIFMLDNGTAQPLRIRGSDSFFSGADLYSSDFEMVCVAAGRTEEDPHGFRDPPVFVAIGAHSWKRVKLHTDLIGRFKGGRCHVRVILFGGTDNAVESPEFTP